MKSTETLRRMRDGAHSGKNKMIAYVPIGCTEQHGPYLPVETDSVIATELAHRISDNMKQWQGYVFPCVNYSPSRSNIGYCGTVSVSEDVFRAYIKEICYGLLYQDNFDAVVLVCGHGSAAPSLIEIAFQIIHEQYQEKINIVKPVLVLNVADISDELQLAFAQEPGRHADWREFLLLFNILGNDYFTPDIVRSMQDFMANNDFTKALAPVIGIPICKRSIDGVIGQPLPLEDNWGEMSQIIWDICTAAFCKRLQMMLQGYDQIR